MAYHRMTDRELIHTYDDLVKAEEAVPVDLSAELEARGYYLGAGYEDQCGCDVCATHAPGSRMAASFFDGFPR